MKILKRILPLAIVAVVLASCSVSAPLLATDNKGGVKQGIAEYTIIFGFMPLNADASIATAAKNGGITKVATVDQVIKASGFFKTTVQTIVTGE